MQEPLDCATRIVKLLHDAPYVVKDAALKIARTLIDYEVKANVVDPAAASVEGTESPAEAA